MTDHEPQFHVSAQPITGQVMASTGPVSIFMSPHEAHEFIDQLQVALRDLAAKEADRD